MDSLLAVIVPLGLVGDSCLDWVALPPRSDPRASGNPSRARPGVVTVARTPYALRWPKAEVKPGWPKTLPCLRCGQKRRATSPGDRMHAECRADPGIEPEVRGTFAPLKPNTTD